MARTWRIVTYNTWKCSGLYHDRLRWMGQGLQALAPDIVCLQEAFECPEHQADTAGYFCDLLGMTAEVLRARKKPRAFGGGMALSSSNLAILAKTPMTRGEDVKLTAHQKDQDRWAMQVSLPLEEGRTLRVLNTHLTHMRDKDGETVRAAQAAQLADLCRPKQGETVALCGDLNDLWNSKAMSPFRQLDWLLADQETQGGTMLGARAGSVTTERRIDQVQIAACEKGLSTLSRRFPALNAPVGPDDEFPSDHAALAVDLVTAPAREEAA